MVTSMVLVQYSNNWVIKQHLIFDDFLCLNVLTCMITYKLPVDLIAQLVADHYKIPELMS